MAGCSTQSARSYGIRSFELTDLSGHADFTFRHREREQKSKTGKSKTRTEETIFEESIGLETEGFVFHPNILEFGLAGLFGLVQEDFREVVDGRQRDTGDDGDLYEYDLHARLFKKREFPLTVFAQRRRGLVPRPFLPSLETTTTNYGLTWQYINKKTPTSLQFSHTDARLSPLYVAGEEDDGRQRNTELRFETGYNFTDHHTLSFQYEYESVDEEPFDFYYDSDEILLTHRLAFGSEHQHRLRSELNYLNQRGTADLERVRWREDLRLKHSGTLESQVVFEALDRERGGRSDDVPISDERSYYLTGLLRHRLYESQTSQIRLFVRQQEFEPDLDITRWGGNVDIQYRKTNPWGVLHADYGFRFERNDHDGKARTSETIDEAHSFRDPDPIVLGSRNIDVSSITIRAEDRVTYYHRGLDYSLQTIGNVVEIRRIPGGRIVDGQTVLIDYLFSTGGTYRLDTLNHRAGIRQDFELGITPYYRFEWQDQSLSPTSATGAIADDITAHLVGVEYQTPALRIFAEYEDRDSTINPFISTRVGASLTHRFEFGAETNFRARWTETRHGVPNERDIELLTLEGRYRHPITENLSVESTVLYRNGEDSASDDTEGIDVSLALEWFIRETEIRMSIERNEFEDAFTSNDSMAAFVHIRRGF